MKDVDILFRLCKAIFWIRGGNYWYDEEAIGDADVFYRIISFAIYFCYFGMTFLELLAAGIGNVSIDERCHALSHGVSHAGYVLKFISITINRRAIQKLLRDLILVCDSLEDDETGMRKYKQIKFAMGLYCGNFFIIISYYGTPGDESPRAAIFRTGTSITIVALLVTIVITIDGLIITVMIIFKYKFIILKKYFAKLNEDMARRVSQKNCDIESAANQLCDGVKQGIVMHISLLRIAQDLDNIFGSIMTIQLFNSSFPAVFLLLQMAVSDNVDFLTSLKILAFIATVFLLLGIYICTFGDITYEALSLSEAIFNCGWHLCPATTSAHRKIRAMVIMGCAQGQIPITMKAFNMVELTHATYVEVIKSTYSVYALLQARNQR
ncbi:uncharacterized protein LOC121734466 [Aricia agestis]|uniref:uncharacterized protein LOC121734466 n=1 Tax=Aricia agestis TaxID=91739 RepID=UPI001C204522|nr:uncharacterized protein LOC121734466 [Aricia agestis]